jgi:DNA-binding NtrC family response regulator
VALEQSNIILPESLRLADFKRETGNLSLGGAFPGIVNFPASQGTQIATVPVAPLNPISPPPEDPQQPRSSALSKLPPGGLDDVLTSLEIYYLINALIVSEGRRGLAAKLLGISPWRLRARLLALDLNDLDAQSLAAISPDRFSKPQLPPDLAPDWTGSNVNLDKIVLKVELHYIYLAMRQSGDNKTEAAILLGLTLRAFKHRLERTNYDREAAKLAILEGNDP